MLAPVATIEIALVHGMLSGIRARGEPVEEHLNRAGIAPELMDRANARVTSEQYIGLFRSLIRRRNDEALAFLSRPMRRGSFALIAQEGISAPTVESGIKRMARALSLMQDDLTLKLVRRGNEAGIELRLREPLAPHPEFLHELILRVSWRLVAWLVDERLPATAFEFPFQQPDYVHGYAKIFPAPLRFASSRSTVWFAADSLSKPVRRDGQALRQFLAASPANVIVPRRDGGVTQAVRNQLQRMLPHWGDLGSVASNLAMSSSTLQRRLSAERTTFQFIKDELRRDLAITRLNTSKVALATLADELGFADSAAFQRAFKHWTGSAPGVYRQGKP